MTTATIPPAAPLVLAAEFPPATEAQWRAAVEAVLKGKPFDKVLVGRTADGIPIQPLYPRKAGAAPLAGREPGIPWTIAQRADHPDPAVANVQALEDLAGGASGLVVVTRGAIGDRRGDAMLIDGLADLDALLAGVMLDLIPVRIDAGTSAGHVAAMIAAKVERDGRDPKSLSIAFGIDPIGAFARRGTLESWEGAAAKASDAVLGLRARCFAGTQLVADGRVIHDAGGAEAQELAYALGTAVQYWRMLEAAGLPLAEALQAISVVLSADADQFLSTAKMRAMRKLWARLETASGLAPSHLDLHAETAWRMVTRVDPAVNWLRTTTAVFAAGIGGADHVMVEPWTAAIGLPDGFARRIARNTQLILIEESNLHRVADAAAGAGGIEALTDELCQRAWTLFQDWEMAGGIVAALSAGSIQAAVGEVRTARAAAIARRREPLTGASEFPNVHEAVPEVLSPPARETQRGAAPIDLPEAGHGERFAAQVNAFAGGAIRAALSRAKSDTVFVDRMAPIRLAAPFEVLRAHLDAIAAESGTRPKVFLAVIGPVAAFTARAAFARNLFEAGGFDAPIPEPFADGAALAEAFTASGATIACLCSSDELNASQAAHVAEALKAAGAKQLWLAGRPGDIEDTLKAAGVDGFVFAGGDVLDFLNRAHAALDA
ncbi:MAG: methylmalonyl-CoA mutase family protein [Phreatobacter sp.]|uniref:methylmalonyl-CoA mutase family protein n=1 Tax=Phreatobacter sp. TaxID=1966341 RepID=UPI0027343647|nr:methylmalonyl-CoA mutase family protein [Phreatobacter sp.]MDP2801755.1 methylmalonyl-CoA mutase family protein [Phreatobacter sp.]